MNKFTLFFFGFVLSFSSLFAQKNLNDYKYVIVPNKFEFLREADKYQLNSLTKFLFNKYGFTALMTDETYPDDLKNNGCLALMSEVENHSSMFKTKLQVKLKDCSSKIIYVSDIGETREKEYKKSYNLALRDAFKSLENTNYKYSENTSITKAEDVADNVKETKNKNDSQVNMLKAKIKELESEKEISKKIEAVEVKSKKPVIKKIRNIAPANNAILYAQKIDNGFQLVNKEPKVLYVLLDSGIKDVYIVKEENAILYKDQNKWIFAQAINDIVEAKYFNIKF